MKIVMRSLEHPDPAHTHVWRWDGFVIVELFAGVGCMPYNSDYAALLFPYAFSFQLGFPAHRLPIIEHPPTTALFDEMIPCDEAELTMMSATGDTLVTLLFDRVRAFTVADRSGATRFNVLPWGACMAILDYPDVETFYAGHPATGKVAA